MIHIPHILYLFNETVPLIHYGASKLIFFPPTVCWNLSSWNLDLHKGSLICGWLSKTVFSGAHGLQLRGAGASSWATARTKVCLPITPHMGWWGSSQVLCDTGSHRSLKVLSSMDGCRIFGVGWGEGGQQWGASYATMMLMWPSGT